MSESIHCKTVTFLKDILCGKFRFLVLLPDPVSEFPSLPVLLSVMIPHLPTSPRLFHSPQIHHLPVVGKAISGIKPRLFRVSLAFLSVIFIVLGTTVGTLFM